VTNQEANVRRDTPLKSDALETTDPHDQLRAWNAHIYAFVPGTATAPHGAIETGALADISMGVKDNIDVAGLPTRNGSDACRNAPPAPRDASVVAALRAAGAHIMGKTTSTEFAFTDPTACRNPHDLRRSPGGSSSGSGAAVAAGLVDMALGTQTAGSLCRPAAYCGVVGFKPSFGRLPVEGVTPLAPSFDTVGLIARSVAVAQRCFTVTAGARASTQTKTATECVIQTALPNTDVAPSPDMLHAFEEAALALKQADNDLDRTPLPETCAIVAHHQVIMNFEAARAHRALLSQPVVELLKPKFRKALELGAQTSTHHVDTAKAYLIEAKTAFWARFKAVDIILTLPVPDGAPLIDGTTGYQDWLTPWTVFGGPLITLPWGLDALGRPRSVMLAGHPGADETLLAVAAELEKQAPPMPRPHLPQRPI
jgi:Asp-tRNA(Asn)/Glu-tRNA(Gln) amidotransferase A subunit family amidase